MADIKWIKITTDIFDDEKILLIESLPDAYAIITVWFKLLCLAGKMNNSGVFLLNDKIAYTDKMLATIFRMKESIVQLALQTFEEFGMIEIVNGVITIPNWEKHQNVEVMDKIREQTRLRVAKHREKQKQIECNVTSNATVTQCNARDRDKDRERDIDKDIKRNIKEKEVAKQPTLDEIKAYISEKGYSVDAKEFFDYYSAGNWHDKDGKPVKAWKQKVVSWNSRNKGKTKQTTKFNNFESRDDDIQDDVVNKLKAKLGV